LNITSQSITYNIIEQDDYIYIEETAEFEKYIQKQKINTIPTIIKKNIIMFSEKELIEIYNTKVKLPESYFKKYEILPSCPVKSYNYNWSHHDFPRTWCFLDFIEWVKKYNITIEHLGCTCDSDPEIEFITPSKKL